MTLSVSSSLGRSRITSPLLHFRRYTHCNFKIFQLSSKIAITLCFDFLYLFTLSVFVGVLFGAACSLLIKHWESLTQYPIKETSLILLFGYTSYLSAELFYLSGILIYIYNRNHFAICLWSNLISVHFSQSIVIGLVGYQNSI